MFIFIYKVEQTITFEQNFYKKFLQHYYNHKLNKMAVLVVWKFGIFMLEQLSDAHRLTTHCGERGLVGLLSVAILQIVFVFFSFKLQ